ncbi:MAG TPA: cytochrome c biogenesis protein CcdA [Solirubrobacteraceae bacterium]|jgi:cytochrome c biogenesis protein CcdA/thiol-disulfide isomerase/thioredoxin|nr:cytochrome c biogenesis protein CcdA [Solirubrobacteraceae bacterium]
MLVLMLFALVAGAGTAITPCVLPVLPALLSASALGGRRRPFGIVLGLALTFTVAIVALAQVAKGVGLAAGATRTLAVVVLIAFGLVMLIPRVAERVQAPLSRLARFGPHTRGTGFWSGLFVGGALGFVCAPCAGPILGAVISVSASGNTSARVVAVAVAYVVGLSAVLTLYSVGGRRAMDLVRRKARGHLVERTLGVVLLLTGVVMATNLDVRFEDTLAASKSLPSFLTDPTRSLESSGAVQNRLASLRPESRFAIRQREAAATAAPSGGAAAAAVALPGVRTPSLPDLGQAPNFTGTQDWFNTSSSRALSMPGLRGHVVLVDFWTYTCINCIRTVPFLKALYAAYHPYGLEIVGVETPEFTFEQEASNVQQAIAANGIRYPVVQDNNYGTWNAYQNEYWPAEYLIDASGEVRHEQPGEGDYKQSEAAVRELLFQSGATHLPPPITVKVPTATQGVGSSETYLGAERAAPKNFLPALKAGVHLYPGDGSLKLGQASLKGIWRLTSQYATPVSAPGEISLNFQAAKVYLVLTSVGNVARRVQVRLNGRPITPAAAGSDVHAGELTVRGQRLYSLVSMTTDEQRLLTVELPPGVEAYDFTFG